ncbi:gamma-aminobutyrate transaminase POP2 [Cucumis melo var. makuwa]|uniref:Gamma-aminobutyrate transaminase POP2 n=1 Tax=Cucumis melo var. makuwa TaxID=1194695 RepID=A0A5D3CI67_CUCMM|nr:gamma-aminobutyrate transaminase POP2 [Cucumis melo var. makuwa]TYK11603.1 gamma-aminobutyrate transaminase POP2 [Cucumis melo var. makuwa]
MWRGSEGSVDMRWHRDKRVETDDVLRQLTDAEGWKHFDCEFPHFASDPRNGGIQKGIKYVPYASDRSSFRIQGRIFFMGHRRYLPENHVWHRSRIHDGKVEHRAPSMVMNGHEILE